MCDRELEKVSMCERESKVYVFGLVLRGESDRKKSRLCPGSFAHEKLWTGLDIVIRQRKGSGIRHVLYNKENVRT